MLKSMRLRDVGPSSALEIDFAPRLNLITGDNGLGKSFLLDLSWWVLTGSWPGQMASPRQGPDAKPAIEATLSGLKPGVQTQENTTTIERKFHFDAARQMWLDAQGTLALWIRRSKPGAKLEESISLAPVVYTRVDGGISVWDRTRNIQERSPDVETWDACLWGIPEAYHFTQESLWNGLKLKDKPVCNGLLQDWVLWQQGADEVDRQTFAMLEQALQVLSPPEGALRPGSPIRILNDARRFPTLELDYGVIPVSQVSAGMKRILSLAYALIWTWSEHMVACRLLNVTPAQSIVLLIDEVESHLHPQWQRVILRALTEVVQAFSGESGMAAQLLAVTHSPLILASVEPWFDSDKDRLWTFDQEGSDVRLKRVAFARRGKADLWLTSEVFDLKEPRSLEAERAIARAKKLLRAPHPDPAEIAAVDGALRGVLSDIDGFWTRWCYFVEQQESSG